MSRKTKGLAVGRENHSKLYPIQVKRVSLNCGSRERKSRGGNMKVSLAMLLKTHVEKMSEKGSLAMLMKSNELKSLSGDVDEKKRS
jgi:hypothetical protein